MSTPRLEKSERGMYYAAWSINRRSKRKSMGTRDLAVAEKRFAEWLLLGGHRGPLGEPVRKLFKMKELWAIYYEKHVRVNNAAPKNALWAWNTLEPFFGHLSPQEIDQLDVDAYVAHRQKQGIKDGSIRRELVFVMSCLSWHCSPARGRGRLIQPHDKPPVVLPKDSEPRTTWLETEQVKQLIEAAASLRKDARMTRVERFIWIAYYTLARERAVCELTWDKVDLERRVIDFTNKNARVTKKRRASAAPIPDELYAILKQAYKERVNNFVLDNKGKIWSALQIVAEKAGLAEHGGVARSESGKPKRSGISPHVLRHTTSTLLANLGVPVVNVAGLMVNTPRVAERTYIKQAPSALRAAAAMIPTLRDETPDIFA